jgi:short-subunit dehydrogenase
MMKSVVITGSTRGIGFGLADAFLALDCNVTVCGRSEQGTKQAVDGLSNRYHYQNIYGYPCDTTQYDQVERLWQEAQTQFGKVDIWINNAGVAHAPQKSWEQSPEVMKSVIETNILGAMYGSKIAIQGMLQQGFGSLYNMEGMGSDGNRHKGMVYYGCSKYGLHYFNESLIGETQGTPVIVGYIRPGMVVTDLITQQFEGRNKEWEQFKPIFNILASRVEDVAPWLARKILNNHRNGVCIEYSNPFRMMSRVAQSALIKKRNSV